MKSVTSSNELELRSKFLVEVFGDYVQKDDSILEIGSGDGRNLRFLKKAGYYDVSGCDTIHGSPFELVKERPYDVIYTMSTFFLFPKGSDWLFEKAARMAQKYIITIEGETTDLSRNLIGRDYNRIFSKLGFVQVEHQTDVFNQYGVLRVFKKYE
jgi:hypothetical protein